MQQYPPYPISKIRSALLLFAAAMVAVFALAPPVAADAAVAAVAAYGVSMPMAVVAGAPDIRAMVSRPDATPAPSRALHLVVHLKGADSAVIDKYVASLSDPTSPNYGHWLTPEQFGQMFGASDQDVASVVAYLQSQGFSVTHVWPNKRFISFDTDVQHASASFHMNLRGYARPDALVQRGDPETFFAPDAAPMIPAAVASKVNAIIGLSDLVRAHSHLVVAGGREPSTSGAPSALLSRLQPNAIRPSFTQPVTPANLSTVYNIDGLKALQKDGTNQLIGIFSPTLRYPTDTTQFASLYNLGNVRFDDKSIDGGATDYGGAVEAALDGEVIAGQAPKATIRYYEGPNSTTTFIDAYMQMAADKCQVVSVSWGTDEYTDYIFGQQQYVAAYNSAAQTLAATGAAIYVASGDTGAYDSLFGNRSVSAEAASASVTGVGGTTLPSNNTTTWVDETAWSYDSLSGSGSGGGVSIFVAEPSWQAGPGVPSSSFRQVPDVAALADPNTPGYTVIYQGQPIQVGGTSASTPLWASANALIDQFLGSQTGSVNPTLYKLATNLAPGTGLTSPFHDITVGQNGAYTCNTGYDRVTGLGSADFTALANAIRNYIKPNLLPVNPTKFSGSAPGGVWLQPIQIHTSASSIAEGAQFTTNNTYQFAIAVANNGSIAAPSCLGKLTIDSIAVATFTIPLLTANSVYTNLAVCTKSLPSGSHTIQITVDSANTVVESNENDNIYTRTINVISAGSPITLVLNPAAVNGTASTTGTLTLPTTSASATVVSLATSDPTAATTPSSVTVPAGAISAMFPITTKAVLAQESVAVTASSPNATGAALLTVNPPIAAQSSIAAIVPISQFTQAKQGLDPNHLPAGTPGLQVVVAGYAFKPGAVVIASNGASVTLTANYISVNAVSTTLPASVMASAGTLNISVQNPGELACKPFGITMDSSTIHLLTASASRDSAGVLYVQVTLLNADTVTAQGLAVSIASLNGVAASSKLPVLGNIPSGRTATFYLVFPGMAATTGTTALLSLSGAYAAGGYEAVGDIAIP